MAMPFELVFDFYEQSFDLDKTSGFGKCSLISEEKRYPSRICFRSENHAVNKNQFCTFVLDASRSGN